MVGASIPKEESYEKAKAEVPGVWRNRILRRARESTARRRKAMRKRKGEVIAMVHLLDEQTDPWVDVLLRVTAQMYYDPGVTDAPMDKCYPPEGGARVTFIELIEALDSETGDPIEGYVLDEGRWEEEIDEQLWEQWE